MKVICFLFDPNVGGPNIRARAVYEKLMLEDYTVRIALPEGKGSTIAYLKEGNITVDQLNLKKPVSPRHFLLFLKYCFCLPLGIFVAYKYLKREEPDLIHVNGAYDIIPAIAGWICGVPVVWHLNDTVFSKGASKWVGKFVETFSTLIITAADRVAQHYNVVNFNKLITIHAPVDVDRFTARRVNDYPSKSPKITLIGNWNWIKGQDRLVELIKKLRDSGVDARGIVAGRFLEGQSQYWEKIKKEISRLELDEYIETPGFVEDTVSLLNDSDILVLTSHSEASPISVLEAMAVGVPVVAFDVGGVREMIGEGASADHVDDGAGIIVAPGNVDEMADGIFKLVRNKNNYRKMSKNGQVRARENFSLDACVRRHKKAYKMAVSEKV